MSATSLHIWHAWHIVALQSWEAPAGRCEGFLGASAGASPASQRPKGNVGRLRRFHLFSRNSIYSLRNSDFSLPSSPHLSHLSLQTCAPCRSWKGKSLAARSRSTLSTQHCNATVPRNWQAIPTQSTKIFCSDNIWQAAVETGPCVAWSVSFRYAFCAFYALHALLGWLASRYFLLNQCLPIILPTCKQRLGVVQRMHIFITFPVHTITLKYTKSIRTFTAMSVCHVGGMLPWLKKFEELLSLSHLVQVELQRQVNPATERKWNKHTQKLPNRFVIEEVLADQQPN